LKLAAAAARRFSEKPDLGCGAALLHGPNRGLIAQASAAIVRAATLGDPDPFAVTRLTDDDLKADRAALMDALLAQSLLGDARLVRVRLDTEAASPLVTEALKALEGGLRGHFLLVEAYNTASSSAMVKAFEGAARAVSLAFYEDGAADLDDFARERFKALKVEASPEAIRALRDAASADRALLSREIEKLATFAHGLGRHLSVDDVDALIGDSATAALDLAGRLALDGAGAQAVEAFEMMEGGSAITALKVLERRLLRLAEARTLADQGMGPQAAIKALKPPVFWKDQEPMADQLRVWTGARLLSALDQVWRCELSCKRAGAAQDLLVAQCYRDVAGLRG
jgi:DNA polymerase III subunit delta